MPLSEQTKAVIAASVAIITKADDKLIETGVLLI